MIYYDIDNKKRWAISLGLIAVFTTPALLSIRLLEIYYSTNLLPNIGDGVLSPLWWLWGTQQFIQNLVWTAFWVLIASMFSDTIEQQEVATGRRLDGLVLSTNNFVTKAMLSSGIFVSGIILSFAGYDTAVTITEKELAAFKLGILSIITIITLVPVALFFISKYQITSSTHETNLRKIENSNEDNIE
jgi:Na+/melibiose symporter-like transporter